MKQIICLLALVCMSAGHLAALHKGVGVASGVGAGLAFDSLGRYASDNADIKRLSDVDGMLRGRPRAQRIYDILVGAPRKTLSLLATSIPSLFILPSQRLAIEAQTRRWVTLPVPYRQAYVTGLKSLSDKQKAALTVVQKKLKRIALGRLIAQAIYGSSMLPYVLHESKYQSRRYVKEKIITFFAGGLGLMAGLIADHVLSVKLRNQYAEWVKKVVAKGQVILAEERKKS